MCGKQIQQGRSLPQNHRIYGFGCIGGLPALNNLCFPADRTDILSFVSPGVFCRAAGGKTMATDAAKENAGK